MFVTLPKVFAEMKIGNLIGAGFFILVLFAALTSSVSVMEAIVSGLDDRYHWGRKKATVICYMPWHWAFAAPWALASGPPLRFSVSPFWISWTLCPTVC